MAADREMLIRRAEQRFEAELQAAGESICIASLPLIVDEVAAEVAGGDGELEAEIESRLRRRAGLHT
jgi:hypothetical protein